MLRTKILQDFQRRWHALPYILQVKEYHSLERLRNAFERTPLYKRIMQRMKIGWIGLKLSPPLLLGLQEGRDQTKKKKEWTEIETNALFYPHEGTPSKVPWDVIEATKTMKQLHIND